MAAAQPPSADIANLKVKVPPGHVLVKATGKDWPDGAACIMPKAVLKLTSKMRQHAAWHGWVMWCRADREGKCPSQDECENAHVIRPERRRAYSTMLLPQATTENPPVMPEDSDDDVCDIQGIGLIPGQKRLAIAAADAAEAQEQEGQLVVKPDMALATDPLLAVHDREVRLKSEVDGKRNAGTVIVLSSVLIISERVAKFEEERGWLGWCPNDRAGGRCRAAGTPAGCNYAHILPHLREAVDLLFDDPRAVTKACPRLH